MLHDWSAAVEPRASGHTLNTSPSPAYPSPAPELPQHVLLRALANRYPFLEVGSPLVIFPDDNLNATFPVFALCGDGLQPRGQHERQVLDNHMSVHEHPASPLK